jgi:hypothetical protein
MQNYKSEKTIPTLSYYNKTRLSATYSVDGKTFRRMKRAGKIQPIY